MGRARGASFGVAIGVAAAVVVALAVLPTVRDQDRSVDDRAVLISEETAARPAGPATSRSDIGADDGPDQPPPLVVNGDETVPPPDVCLSTRTERRAVINAVIDEGPSDRETPRTPEFDLEYRRAVVATMYCQVLGRPADGEGLEFWAAELGAGMSVYEFYLLLAGSEEYQLRDVLADSEVLRALQLSEELQALAAGTASTIDQTAADGEAAMAEATTTAATQATVVVPDPTTTTAAGTTTSATVDPEAEARELALELDRAAGVGGYRARAEITKETFDGWVTQHGLQDLDRVTDALVHGTRHGGNQQVNVAFVHLSETRGIAVSPGGYGRSTVGRWAQEIGAHVAINGNWYSPWDGPAVSGGVPYAGADHGYTSLFGFTADGDAIIEHHREVNDVVDPLIVEGVSGHPTLIHRGDRTTDFGTDPTFLNRHPRTAIGLDQTGDVLILVTVDGRRSSAIGMTGAETVQLMADVGAFDAVMLDGGGSSTMWIAGRGVVNRPSGGLRAVGNQIAVFGD